MALERSIAMLFQEGEIRRHLKKSLKIYHQRRDHFCESIKVLSIKIQFEPPEGGLATWMKFDPSIDINKIRDKAMNRGLLIPKSVFYDKDGQNQNAIRMGFASLEEEEMKKAIGILKKVIDG